MELRVTRRWKKPLYTIGRLEINGVYFCDTLEDTDRGLWKEDSLSSIKKRKIAGETAIPAGRYRVTLGVKSPKYATRSAYAFCDGRVPRLLEVPCFDGILIHIGNSPADTAGCLLVGRNTQVGKVMQSSTTFRALYAEMEKAWKRGEAIWIEIGY